jgi:adenylate cyclase
VNFIKNIFSERRLRFDIATIFTILLAATSFFIISYTYLKIHKSILNFAEMTINRAGRIILEKVTCFDKEYQEIPQDCDSLIISAEDVSENNKSLIYYLQRKLQLHPIVFGVYFGTTSGGMLNIENIKQTKQKTYYNDHTKPIPQEASFVIETINREANPPFRVRKYVDNNLKVLTEEYISPIAYDPRTRPWYQGAISSQETFWTAPYTFIFPPVYGVTVSRPFYSNITDQMLGAAGVDLTLQSISDFIRTQNISKNGRAYIIDKSKGEIILPLESSGKNAPHHQLTVIKESYDQFQIHKKNSFVQKVENEDYLVSIFSMPESFNDRWLVAITAPLDDFFFEIFETQKFVIIISSLIFLFSCFLVIVFSRKISKPITTIANEVDKITHFDFSSPIRIKSNIKEIKILDASVAAMREAIYSFSKYVPKDIVKQLIKQGKSISLGGEKKQIVVMFSDIENFTPIAEKNTADNLMTLLEEYFDPMSKTILESQGTIDKYIGDSIMAFWGAPENVTSPWIKACQAVLRCLKLNYKFDALRKEKQLPPFPTRYGLSVGQAIVGNIGTEERINYTALGDIVNIASRLQSTNKLYNTSILITEELNELVKETFITRPVDEVAVKGKEIKIKIFELISENSSDPEIGASESDRTLAKMTLDAFNAQKSNSLQEAISKYEKIIENFPQDGVAEYWINKLKKNSPI